MAMKVKIQPQITELNDRVTVRLGTNTVALAGNLVDADVGKPVKIVGSSRYGLCADGDVIEGWLESVNPDTDGGYAYGTVQLGGKRYVQLSGDVAIGALVAAGAPATAGTAETNHLGKVSTHVGATTDQARWQLVESTGLDGDLTAVVKRC